MKHRTRYAVGEYQLLLFGEYSEKLETQIFTTANAAKKEYKAHLEKNPKYSAVINRTLYNSLNNDKKWSYVNDVG